MSEIPDRESLTIEFKSDRKKLPDRDLVMAVVCLANTQGGVIYLGVEDDATVTGLHPEHRDLTGLTVLTPDQASRLLRDLVSEGKLVRRGDRKGAVYTRP